MVKKATTKKDFTVIFKSIGIKYEAKGTTVFSALQGIEKQNIKNFLKMHGVFTVQTKDKEAYTPMNGIIKIQNYKFGTQHALKFLADILEDKLKRA